MVRRNFGQIVAPFAVVQIPLAALAALGQWAAYTYWFPNTNLPETPSDILAVPEKLMYVLALTGVVWMMTLSLGINSSIVAIRDVVTGSRRPLPEVLDPSFTHLGPLVTVTVFLMALWFLATVTAWTIVLPVLCLLLLVRFSFAVHSFALDTPSFSDSLRASWNLTRGNAMRILGLGLLLLPVALLAVLVASVFATAATAPILILGSAREVMLLANAVSTVAVAVGMLPYMAFALTATTLLFINLRGQQNG